jgi:hypothetical protein
MNPRDWDHVLETFAERLGDQRTALGSDVVDSVPPFAPPPSLGPMPARLRTRAESLLQEAAEIQAEMVTRLASTAREVQAVRRFVDASPSSARPSYLDSVL